MAETEDGLYTISNSLWTGETNNSNEDSELEEERNAAPTSVQKATLKKEKGKVKVPPKKRRLETPCVRQNKVVCTVANCSYSTPYPKDLARHMRKHTGEKPFTCDLCHKSFSRYDKLLGHKRAHEGIRPNKCNMCEYAALDAGSLRKHLRVHLDERPYNCQMCPYRARDSSQLIVHLRHHTGDSPYTCSYETCQAAFKTPSDLRRHTRHHTGEKPYACPHCEYRASVKCNLNAHTKKYHNMKNSNPTATATGASVQSSGVPVTTDFVSKNIELENSAASLNSKLEQKKPNHQNKSFQEQFAFQFACKLCDYKGETIKHFHAHMKRKHKITQKLVRDTNIMQPPKKRNLKEFPKIFVCSSCPATFVREDSLRCHVRQHASLGPPPMPIISIEPPQMGTNLIYDNELTAPFVEEQYLGHVEAEEIVESVSARPNVITFNDKKYT